MGRTDWRWMVTLVLSFVSVGVIVGEQAARRPSGRLVPGSPVPTATITPTPDPCAGCPAPGSFTCAMWPLVCFQCWEDCGRPIATHTPTPIPVQPTRTPQPGPECVLHMTGPGRVLLVAVWAHGDAARPLRYTYEVFPRDVPPGSYRGDPDEVEGTPVGYEWWDANSIIMVKSCGDTGRIFVHPNHPGLVFADGFETGDSSRWSSEAGGGR